MLSSMYFEELDPIRKRIQSDLMGKVDCVREACQESYDNGFSEGLNDVAKRMLLNGDYSLDEISKLTGFSLDEIARLKRSL